MERHARKVLERLAEERVVLQDHVKRMIALTKERQAIEKRYATLITKASKAVAQRRKNST